MTDRLLTATELAEHWNVPEGWVRAKTRSNEIPHVKLGRYRRYVKADCDAWLEAQTAGGGPGWRKHRPQLANVSDNGTSE